MRKSSRGAVAPAPQPMDPLDVIRAREFMGYEPTDLQMRTKAKMWAMYREDPLISPDNMKPSELARVLDAPSLEAWWSDPNFRSWFLQKDGWRHDTEFAFQLWMDDCLKRLRTRSLSDKDFLAFGKLLAELTSRMGGKREEEKEKPLSKEEAARVFEVMAPALGFVRAEQLPPPTADVEESK